MARYLITGATRGIGRALVDALQGHELIALGRDGAALAELPVASYVVADLADPASLAAALPAWDSLDGLVHSAGIAVRGTLADAEVAAWQELFTVNVVAPAELTRRLLAPLRAAGGTVVFVNSGQGLSASPGSTVYAATKFALRSLADSVRGEEPLLRVCTVYPGRVATEMQRQLRAQERLPYVPSEYLRPETVAAAIAQVLATPADGVVHDLTLRPRGT